MSGASWDPRNWAHELIEDECRTPYRAYHRELRARHIAYYASRPEQRSLNEKRPFEARKLADAFPPGYEHLATRRDIAWHTHAKSAGSSQVLLLALLQPVIEAEPSLKWLWQTSGALAPVGTVESTRFEVTLPRELLNESGDRRRWTGCSTATGASSPSRRSSPSRDSVAARAPTAKTANAPPRCSRAPTGTWRRSSSAGHARPTKPCPVSLAYQAVRNAAAAVALAGPERLGGFALVYDDRNPYFAGAGEWPGWAGVLEATFVDAPDVHFAAVSWQQLFAVAPVPDAVREWAAEKHGLLAQDRSRRPVLCGYDGDGDFWVEVCEAVPSEQDALREVAKLDHGAEIWKVVGSDWLSPSGGEWRECPVGAEGARRFWHVQWSAGPGY